MSMPMGQSTDDLGSRDEYERSDVKARSVIWLFLSVLIGIGIAQLGLWELLRYFRLAAERHAPQVSPLADTHGPPPAPRLQEHPLDAYRELVTSHKKRLDSIGWIDQRKKTVHIPITRAMDLIVERGLPEAAMRSKTPDKGEPDNANRIESDQ